MPSNLWLWTWSAYLSLSFSQLVQAQPSTSGTRKINDNAEQTLVAKPPRPIMAVEPSKVDWDEAGQWTGHNKDVWQIAFCTNRTHLVTCGDDNRIIVWDINSGQIAKSIPHNDEKHGLAFSAAAGFFAICYKTPWGPASCGQARLMDIQSGEVIMEAPSLRGGCFHRVDIHPTGLLLAAGGADSSVMAWVVNPGDKKLIEFKAPPALPDEVWGLSINPSPLNRNGHQIAVGCRNGNVVILEATAEKGILPSKIKIAGHRAGVPCVQYNPSGNVLASSDAEGIVLLWEAHTGKQFKRFETNGGIAESLAFSPNGKLLAVAQGDGEISIWGVDSGKRLASLKGHAKAVLDVAFHPDGRMLASASRDYTVRLWKIR